MSLFVRKNVGAIILYRERGLGVRSSSSPNLNTFSILKYYSYETRLVFSDSAPPEKKKKFNRIPPIHAVPTNTKVSVSTAPLPGDFCDFRSCTGPFHTQVVYDATDAGKRYLKRKRIRTRRPTQK